MKNYIIKLVCLGIIFFTFSENVYSQGRLRKHPEFHYFTLSLSGGYSSLLTDYKNIKTYGGPGATFGIGYEYHYRSFWLSLGVEAQYFNSRIFPSISDTIVISAFDTEDDPMKYRYNISKWNDSQTSVYVNVPFMLGFNVKRFYMGAGVKAGMSFYGMSSSKMDYRTAGVYDRFIDDFVDMPNHFYDNYSSTSEKSLKFLPKASAIAEIGYEVVSIPKSKNVTPLILKVGAYAEYGFLNVIDNNSEVEVMRPSDPDPSQIVVTPYFLSTTTNGHSVLPLYVGVKATLMFELPLPQKCHCLQTERGASWRNDAPREVKKLRKQMKRNKKQKSVTNNNKK